MSLESLAVAFAAKGLRPRTKLVLLLLANRNVLDTCDLTPAATLELAVDAGMTLTEVELSISELIDRRFIFRCEP